MKENKRLKLGVLSSVMVVGIVALAVLINVWIGKLNISWDMTPKQIYTISEQSKSILGGLEQDITIYVLASEEGLPIDYKQILQQYEKGSSHIQVRYRDLTVYPGFATEFTNKSANENSMIVVCGDKHVYLDAEDFQRTTLNEDYTYSTTYELEPLLTAAINSVNDGVVSVVYQTVGHSELDLTSASQVEGDIVVSSTVLSGLTRDNYSVEDLDLLNLDAVPEDADIVVIHAPISDFSKADCDKLRDYLNQGGNIYYIMDATLEHENLNALMKEYGIEVVEGIVMEQNTSMIYGGGSDSATPTYILPTIEDTEITHEQCQSRIPLIVPIAKGLVEHPGSGYTVTGLLSTSNYAYSKVNLYSQYLSREDDDILGPFYLAALSEKEDGGKLIVLSSVNVLADNVDEAVSGNNSDFFLNGLNYMIGDTDKISIRGKEVAFDFNVYSTNEALVIGGMAIFGIPILIILAGVVVSVYRKRRSQGKWRKEDANEMEEAVESEEDTESETTVTSREVDESEDVMNSGEREEPEAVEGIEQDGPEKTGEEETEEVEPEDIETEEVESEDSETEEAESEDMETEEVEPEDIETEEAESENKNPEDK